MPSTQSYSPIARAASCPILLGAVGLVLMSLPFAIKSEIGIAPAELAGWTKFCLVVATFTGLAAFSHAAATVMLMKPRDAEDDEDSKP